MNFLWFKKKGKYPVSTKSVKFSYDDKEILRDINLNVKEKKVTAIIGKSGSGKSTLLKIIAGIITRKYGGKIRIFGMYKFLGKSKIGFVPQEVSMIPDLSIKDNLEIHGMNVGISKKESEKRAKELMGMLNFNEDLNKKPQELSGGQKVRLNIILSLLNEPDTIILDEPFVGLDFLNRKLLWHFIHSLKQKGKSIILTSHLLTETQGNVDKIILLKDGKVFFSGNIDALKNRLKMNFIMEIKFPKVSNEKKEKMRKYFVYHDIKVIDSYDKYMMFSIDGEGTRDKITSLFKRLKINFDVIGYREPNLDEIFLGA